MSGGDWRVERQSGPAAALHASEPPAAASRTARILEVTDTALVLGSGQDAALVDTAALTAAGATVVRRGSGGGAVLLAPQRQLWVDLWVPAGDPLRDDDVIRGAFWVGDTWAHALAAHGISTTVHRSRHEAGGWADAICFLGRGPGEVFADQAKVVGLSQRRTRAWLRVQTLVHRDWDVRLTIDLLAGAGPQPAELARLQAAVHAVGDLDLGPALIAALPD